MTGSANSDRPSRQSHTLLLAIESKNSVLVEVAGGMLNSIAYSAYGYQYGRLEISGRLGFNGELREGRLGWYLLGNGYRAYNPVLMRFDSPDSLSPFGKGGLNAYMYCVGDPVNFSDPTGHMGWLKSLRVSLRRTSSAQRSSSPSRLTQGGIDNPNYEHTETQAIYKTIPALTRTTHTEVITRNFIDIKNSKRMPPPIPPMKRINDTGGQVGIISPNWKPGQPPRYREIWKSTPSNFAPTPPPRTLANGLTRKYSVRHDAKGNPTQTSAVTITFFNQVRAVRKQ